jgi:hypothetical protein
MIRRTVLALLFAVGAVPLSAQPCFACSCAPRPEHQTRQEYREEQARRADVVFTGKVRRLEYSEQTLTAHFRVGKAYKGTHRERLTIKTNSTGAACGYSFKDGKRYTVFGTGDGPESYRTYICTGTQRGRIDPADYGLE